MPLMSMPTREQVDPEVRPLWDDFFDWTSSPRCRPARSPPSPW